jgi:hypothetical protein
MLKPNANPRPYARACPLLIDTTRDPADMRTVDPPER